jgi:hypothetical protein
MDCGLRAGTGRAANGVALYRRTSLHLSDLRPMLESGRMQGAQVSSIASVPVAAPSKPSASQRYLALDAYRGFIMVVLVSGGFGLAELAARRPAFTGIANQFEHMPWEWIAFWDLIQPAFMFMVGVAMPFALAWRLEQGATQRQLFGHVAMRSFRLILMSQILMSIDANKLQFQLINVLAQIGITYFLCYLIMQLEFRWQAVIAVAILIGHWALFVAFPGTEGPFLSKTTNVGAVIDTWVFGHPNPDDWVNINFLTSTRNHAVWRVDGPIVAKPAIARTKNANTGDLSRSVPRYRPDHPSLEPNHQAGRAAVGIDLRHPRHLCQRESEYRVARFHKPLAQQK